MRPPFVDHLVATGPCDFVPTVAARLPLKIICDMMALPREQYDVVPANSNIILSGADPEFPPPGPRVIRLLGAAEALTDLVTGLAADRAPPPGEDLGPCW